LTGLPVVKIDAAEDDVFIQKKKKKKKKKTEIIQTEVE